MSLFTAFDILSSGMSAQRVRLNVVSSNLANARTTRSVDGGPYRRLEPVFQAASTDADAFASHFDGAVRGVQVAGVVPDSSPFQQIYDPGHPDANGEGFVEMPNVNVMEEMVNMITASRSFEATTQAFQTIRSQMLRSLDIGR